jgi:cytochrome P450
MHLSEKVWGKDASLFQPSRWDYLSISGQENEAMDPTKRVLHAYEYTPFLGGPRQCIGKQFALMELKLFVAHLVRKYRWSLPENAPAPTKSYTITARPKNAFLYCVER